MFLVGFVYLFVVCPVQSISIGCIYAKSSHLYLTVYEMTENFNEVSGHYKKNYSTVTYGVVFRIVVARFGGRVVTVAISRRSPLHEQVIKEGLSNFIKHHHITYSIPVKPTNDKNRVRVRCAERTIMISYGRFCCVQCLDIR